MLYHSLSFTKLKNVFVNETVSVELMVSGNSAWGLEWLFQNENIVNTSFCSHFPYIFTSTLLLSRYRTIDTLFVCLRNANAKIEDFDTKQEELEHQIRLLRIAVGDNEISVDKLMSLELDFALS